MNQIPIDANARGALLEARDAFMEFNESIDAALPALQHCGIWDLEMRAAWIAGKTAEMRRALEVAVQQTTELRANKFAAIPAPERVETPVFRFAKGRK